MPKRLATLGDAIGQSRFTAPASSDIELVFAPAVLGLVCRLLAR